MINFFSFSIKDMLYPLISKINSFLFKLLPGNEGLVVVGLALLFGAGFNSAMKNPSWFKTLILFIVFYMALKYLGVGVFVS